MSRTLDFRLARAVRNGQRNPTRSGV